MNFNSYKNWNLTLAETFRYYPIHLSNLFFFLSLCKNLIKIIVNYLYTYVVKGLSTVNQQVVIGSENTTCLTQDIPYIGDQTFKVGKLCAEERK